MTEPGKGVLLGSFVRLLVTSGGGDLHYKPVEGSGGKIEWNVFVRRADGAEMQVFVTRTGEPKRLKSANAVVSFHQSHYPGATKVTIPVLPRSNEGPDLDEDD